MSHRALIWGMVSLALSQPIFLLLVHFFKMDSDTVRTVDQLGSLMGAIFTAGGLIVAITSIYTMANVEKVTQQAVQPLLEGVSQKIDARIRQFLQAYGYFTQAQSVWTRDTSHNYYGNYDYIESLVEGAIELEPSIHGMYVWLGEIYYDIARRMSIKEMFRGDVGDMYRGLPPRSDFPYISERAIYWMEKAYYCEDGELSSIAMRLASLHGMIHSPLRKVFFWLEKSSADMINNEIKKTGFLYGACHTRREVFQLANFLKEDIPCSKEKIKQLLEQHQASAQRAERLALCVVPRFDKINMENPTIPGVLYVYHHANDGKGLAQWVIG